MLQHDGAALAIDGLCEPLHAHAQVAPHLLPPRVRVEHNLLLVL